MPASAPSTSKCARPRCGSRAPARSGGRRAGMPFPADGRYVVAGALVPVEFAGGRGVYVEPNVWMRHPSAPRRSPYDPPGPLAQPGRGRGPPQEEQTATWPCAQCARLNLFPVVWQGHRSAPPAPRRDRVQRTGAALTFAPPTRSRSSGRSAASEATLPRRVDYRLIDWPSTNGDRVGLLVGNPNYPRRPDSDTTERTSFSRLDSVGLSGGAARAPDSIGGPLRIAMGGWGRALYASGCSSSPLVCHHGAASVRIPPFEARLVWCTA